MATMISGVYGAFKEAFGVSGEKARNAAEAVAQFDSRFGDLTLNFESLKTSFDELRGRVTLLTWMVGFNLAISLGILWRIIR